MEQSAGIEHVRPELTAGEALCAAVEAHQGNIFVRTSPLGAILPLVVAHVRATDKRLRILESRATSSEVARSDLLEKLDRIIEVGKKEGQL